jgi:hypothetical protein
VNFIINNVAGLLMVHGVNDLIGAIFFVAVEIRRLATVTYNQVSTRGWVFDILACSPE